MLRGFRCTDINHIRDELNELIFKHYDMTVCREDLLSTARACNLELERGVVRPRQCQVTAVGGGLPIPLRFKYKRWRQDVAGVVRRVEILGVDLDIDSLLGLVLHLENQGIDVVAESLAMRPNDGEVGGEAARSVCYIRGSVAGTLLRIWCGGVVDGWCQARGCINLGAQGRYCTLGA